MPSSSNKTWSWNKESEWSYCRKEREKERERERDYEMYQENSMCAQGLDAGWNTAVLIEIPGCTCMQVWTGYQMLGNC